MSENGRAAGVATAVCICVPPARRAISFAIQMPSLSGPSVRTRRTGAPSARAARRLRAPPGLFLMTASAAPRISGVER